MFKGGKMEDFVLETDVLTEFEFEAPREHNIRVVIVKTEKFLEIENEDIMGQTSLDWVKNNGCKDFEKDKVHIAKLGKNQSLLDVALPFVKEGDDYLLVLYADTPLLQSLDVNDAVEYATTKNLDYCKLPRGCVFKVKSAKANKFEMTSEANFFAKYAIAPPVLVHKIGAECPQDIYEVFDISFEAAVYAYEYYCAWKARYERINRLTVYEKKLLALYKKCA